MTDAIYMTGLEPVVHQTVPEGLYYAQGDGKTNQDHDQEAGTVNLTAWLREAFIQAGMPDPSGVFELIDEAYLSQFPMSYQRYMLNRNLNSVINAIRDEQGDPLDARDIRYCMVNDGPLQTWQDLISSTVIPYILGHFKRLGMY